jgi:enoyl-CoA hydratase/carnithine racemase
VTAQEGGGNASPAAEPVLVSEQRGAVRVLRLNRPAARNALNPELMSELGLALTAAENDPEVRCVILTGTGDRAFCAGMDLRAFAERGTPSPRNTEGAAAFGRFIQGKVSLPVVGAANATAVAGGFELLLGCDVVVASDQASFGLPEVKRGLFAAGGGVFISTRIPLAVALELTLTGDPVDAQRALALGLINRVVPPMRSWTRRSRWPSGSRRTDRLRCAPPSSSCVPPIPTWARHRSCWPGCSPRYSAAPTLGRALRPLSNVAIPSGPAANQCPREDRVPDR